jgi:hypothetical protein
MLGSPRHSPFPVVIALVRSSHLTCQARKPHHDEGIITALFIGSGANVMSRGALLPTRSGLTCSFGKPMWRY